MDDFKKLLENQGDELQLILGYGDSNDGTGEALFDECANRFAATLKDVSHGGHNYGSIVHPQRFKQLAFVGNTLWGLIPKDADVVALVESDLIWQGDTLLNLRNHLNLSNLPVILAPMVYHTDMRFYDTWAFRLYGVHFTNHKPYHPALITPEISSRRYYEMDSVGSLMFMQGKLARQLHWPERDVVVGLCRIAKGLGAKIILDSFAEVYHP